jgi:steroid 5-alpha reductase family enzyme
MHILFMLLAATAACCVVMWLVWLWQKRIANAGVVDIVWSYNFPLIAVIYFVMGDGWFERRALIAVMVLIWGIRLGTYLYIRVLGHIHEEDGRYKQLRTDWSPNFESKLFWFYQMQAVSNVLLSVPFLLASLNPATAFHPLEIAGAAIWLLAILGEAVADRQLQKFKSNKANKGKVCDAGLWGWSRHPNYFFEWCIWLGYFVFACASPWGWLSIICPAIILYLLLRVTGIPMNEEQNLRSKPEAYKAYQQRVSKFVPLPPKKAGV